MIGSIMLLIGFVSYFLKSEYDQEKAAIRLEQRDEVFVRIISTIDTLFDENLLNQEGTSMRWAHDTAGTKIEYRLKYMDDSLKIPSIQDNFKFGDSLAHNPIKLLRGKENMLPSFATKTDTFISIIQHFDEPAERQQDAQTIELSATFHGDSSLNKAYDLINFAGSPEGFGKFTMDRQIAPATVLKRMFPQFAFSLLLLFVVIISFYLISRSLQQAHQLTALKNDFISNISHELKTPISTISVALEALSNFDAGNDPKLRKEYIEISKMEAERLDLLVNKTLNISLYEQGKFVLDQQVIALDQEINRILRSLKPALEQKHVQVAYAEKAGNYEVLADKSHMTNVIYNLIENAIKYSPSPAKLELILTEKVKTVELEIIDHGVGIEAHHIDKIFDKFFRVPQGDVHNVKGHGLGLSYVREVVKKQGGEIKVQSKFGEGSSFKIIMPKPIPSAIIE